MVVRGAFRVQPRARPALLSLLPWLLHVVRRLVAPHALHIAVGPDADNLTTVGPLLRFWDRSSLEPISQSALVDANFPGDLNSRVAFHSLVHPSRGRAFVKRKVKVKITQWRGAGLAAIPRNLVCLEEAG